MGVTVAVHTSAVTLPILGFGTDEQRSRFVPPLARGEAIGAFALTEPEAGSDAGSLRTAAVADGDGWTITGSKQWITNGAFAGSVLLFARTDPDTPGPKGVSAFVLDGDQVRVTREEEKLGLNSSSTVDLAIEGARAGRDRLLHEEGKGFTVAMSTLDGGRIGIAAQALGIAQAAYDVARDYALERRQFGKRIAEFQAIQWKLADMATEIDAARLLVYRAAWLKQEGRPHTEAGAKAKLFASEMARRQTAEAIQVLGGYGYTKEFPVERYYRDAKITEIYEGTSEIQRLVIARSILGLRERSSRRDEPARARRAGPADEDLHARRRPRRDEPRRRLARLEARPASSPTAPSTSSTRSSGSCWPCATSSRAARAARRAIQNELFDLGADLSVPFAEGDERLRVTQEQIDALERSATSPTKPPRAEELRPARRQRGRRPAARRPRRLPPRRAARRSRPHARSSSTRSSPVYLNRLSDLLFILARAANGGDEPLWRPGGLADRLDQAVQRQPAGGAG